VREPCTSSTRLTAVGVKGRDEAADAELPARDADHDLALGDKRGERHVVAGLPVLDLLLPDHLAGRGVERHEHAVVRGEIDLVAVEGDTTTVLCRTLSPSGHFLLVSPQQLARLGLEGHDLVVWRRDEHDAVVDEQRRLVPESTPVENAHTGASFFTL